MKNRVQDGKTLNYLNDSGDPIVSGQIVELAARICVACADIAEDATGSVDMEGVYNLPKLAGEAHEFGDNLHFDPADGNLKLTATALTKYAGMCAKAAASADTTVDCKLENAPISFVAP